ncbi:HNH endonuclease [Alkalihalobacillus sp. NPDC078783]
MPSKPRRPCNHVGCTVITDQPYCNKHKVVAKASKDFDNRRGSASSRGYDARWRKARKMYLRRNPLCVRCEMNNDLVSATIVDHIKPYEVDMQLFWNEKNWQALCKTCHCLGISPDVK